VWWRGGGTLAAEPAEQRERIHVHSDGAVREGLLQDDADQAVLPVLDLVLRDGRSQYVAEQGLAARGVEGTGAGRRVKGEAVLGGAEGLVVGECFWLEGQQAYQPLRPSGWCLT
jgi:hypothetical protein